MEGSDGAPPMAWARGQRMPWRRIPHLHQSLGFSLPAECWQKARQGNLGVFGAVCQKASAMG